MSAPEPLPEPTPAARPIRVAGAVLMVLALASVGLALVAGGMSDMGHRFLYGGLAALGLMLMAGPMMLMDRRPAIRRVIWSLVWGGAAGLAIQLFFAGLSWPDTAIALAAGMVLAGLVFGLLSLRGSGPVAG